MEEEEGKWLTMFEAKNNSHWSVLLVKATVKAAYDIVCLLLKADRTKSGVG